MSGACCGDELQRAVKPKLSGTLGVLLRLDKLRDAAPVRWDDKLITFRRSSCDLR